MSKVPMKRIFICGMQEDKKSILDLLQRKGVVEISENPEEYEDCDLKTTDTMADRIESDRKASVCERALEILESNAPDPDGGLFKSFEGASSIDVKEYESRALKNDEYYETAEKLIALDKKIAEAKADIPKCETKIETLKPWLGFDLPLDFEGTKESAAFIGSVSDKKDLSEIYEGLMADLDDGVGVDVSIISSSDDMTCIFVVGLRKDKEQIEEALKGIGFAKAQLSKTVPAEEVKNLERQISEDNKFIEACVNDIKALSSERDNLKFLEDYYRARSDKFEALGKMKQTKRTFFMEGYIPKRYAESITKLLENKYDAVVKVEDPAEDEDVPVELKNGLLTDPMETVVESYSLPGNGEIDPSVITAVFYYIFFGLMLADVGYGILMVAGTGIVLMKCKNIKPGMKKMMKLFLYCGIATIFWGAMFGSFFGDAVTVIATTFFGRPDIKFPVLWFEPVNEPMKELVFAFALGIIHIFTGLTIKLYQCIKAGAYKDAIYDVVFWYMFVGGGIVYLLTMPMITGMLSLGFTFGPTVATVSGAMAIAGCIGVVLTGGRESRNWFKRILKGAYSAYGVSSYLSDVLSYSRLLALGLASGVISTVFNKMGSMLGATWYGALLFIAVFLVGHAMNLAINVLGSYVHTNRLQFVEFYGKFYDGGGRKFTPFRENTKYYKVKEDD
ncbi:MAG: V-type ATP synthase subunit I [Candidatus Avilachnospira sp.]|jgi:V/A-type H+-transporting ATPase subunit I